MIIEDIEEEQVKKYIGGSSLGAKILFEETLVQSNPLGSEKRTDFYCSS
jgi:aldehyde:ferredoxin oxidoreductase